MTTLNPGDVNLASNAQPWPTAKTRNEVANEAPISYEADCQGTEEK